MTHPYFDELKEQGKKLPNGNCMPDLFNFNEAEIKAAGLDTIS